MSESTWVLLIILLTNIINSIMVILNRRAADKEAEKTKQKVEEVRTDLATNTTVQAVKLDHVSARVDAVAENVQAVHLATNSLTDRLVAKTEAEALVRGGVEERARADTRLQERGGGT